MITQDVLGWLREALYRRGPSQPGAAAAARTSTLEPTVIQPGGQRTGYKVKKLTEPAAGGGLVAIEQTSRN